MFELYRRLSVVLGLSAALFSAHAAVAQAVPAVNRGMEENTSIFVMGTETQTGFMGSNRALTAGASLTLRPFGAYTTAVELRATYPLSAASTASKEMTVLGGPVVRRRFGRFEPYGDVLFGLGRVDYPSGYIYNTLGYVRTTGFTYSPGGGVDVYLNPRLSVKADIQMQHWGIPVTESGTAWARAMSVGVSYHFSAFHRSHKADRSDPQWHPLSQDYPGVSH
ncbi:MAG: outer membrane beta-barrel protein [Edaphobacter sp.]|uniref:outer membrane beta-barrel protein n=1 Tax=Edaphobacter sp. TaxID=1934404 RepID=UPI00238A5E76|nr:outer membrane beta-barrel protein [Edaphobacter sp.]MDE1178094.1 outer membrane beta-barrel protein [Edaphobacter sp.]